MEIKLIKSIAKISIKALLINIFAVFIYLLLCLPSYSSTQVFYQDTEADFNTDVLTQVSTDNPPGDVVLGFQAFAGWDLTPWAGQNVRIYFEVHNLLDTSLNSWAFIDDVNVSGIAFANGGFESGVGTWVFGGTGGNHALSNIEVNSGSWSGLIGYYPPTPNIMGGVEYVYRQFVPVAGSKLTYWYRFHTQDYCPYDYIRIYLKDATGTVILATFRDWCVIYVLAVLIMIPAGLRVLVMLLPVISGPII